MTYALTFLLGLCVGYLVAFHRGAQEQNRLERKWRTRLEVAEHRHLKLVKGERRA
jgi:hypothetical protein